MEYTDFWHKQEPDQPLFPDLIWNRPENKLHAGRLLIAGGNIHGFNAPATAYSEAQKAGIGAARVMLPDSLQKTVGTLFPETEFLPSTPSGSFAQTALAEFLATAEWADGVLLAGDFGRNSETAIMLEKFTQKYSGQLTLTKDAVDYFAKAPKELLQREDTTLVVSLSQLQQVAIHARFTTPITLSMGILQLAEALHIFTSEHTAHIVTQHVDNVLVAVNGRVSTTKLAESAKIWRVSTAAHISTWWLQNPNKSFEALSTALIVKT